MFSPHFYPVCGQTVFVICLEHARTFAEAGWSKREVAERIVEASKRRVGDMRRGDQGPFAAALDDDAQLAKWLSADEVVIVVAGGEAASRPLIDVRSERYALNAIFTPPRSAMFSPSVSSPLMYRFGATSNEAY